MDKEGKYSFTYVSNGFEVLTGISRELIQRDNTYVFQNIHRDDFDKFLKSITDSAENMSQWKHKFRMHRHDLGKSIWIKGVSNPEKAEDGSILWNGIIIDTTESEELYENYITSNKRYEYVTKATNDAIWDWDLVTNKLYWGDGFERIFGFEPTEDIFNIKFWEDSIHDEDKERVLTSINNSVLSEDNLHWEENYRLRKKDGTYAHVSDKGYIIHNKYGRPIRMVGAIKDVTHIHIAEAEKQKLMNDLLRRNEALEQFTYIVSHNLRAPVANLLGLTDTFRDENLDGQMKDAIVQYISDSSLQLDNVLKDLNYILNFSDDSYLKKEIIDFESLFRTVSEEQKDIIEESGAEFITDFSAAPKIKIVYKNIHHIFTNLISNSIRFKSDRKPVIKITSGKNDRFIYLEFEDNGIGVDLDKFGYKIYDLYHTFHPEIKGKGIGLYMIKTIMDNLHGTISIASKVGTGTNFSLKFINLL